MSEDRDGFLSRWSRRKIEVRREEAHPPTPAEPTEPIPEPSEAADEPELTPEEIAALPKVEEMTAETDITVFLRKGVPELLRKAALRRMWSVDPAIRDYVSEAREYAYDWNVPGGVPGNGPLLPSDNVAAMLRRVFGENPPEGDAVVAGDPAGEALSRSRESDPAEAPPEAEEVSAAGEPEAPDTAAEEPQRLANRALPQPGPGSDLLVPPAPASPESAISPRLRRHGGAKPV
jgi:hypothetical protein